MRILPGIVLLLSHFLLAQQPAKPASTAAETHSPAATGCQPASTAQVKKMMELAGSKKVLEGVMETIVRQIFDEFKRMRPDIPPQVWDVSLARLETPQNLQGLLDAVVPIYQRHFCADEIEHIIEFYQTPAGHKLSAELPAIQREASEAGRNYATRISTQLAQDVQQELAKQGVKLGTPPRAAENASASPPPPAVFILSSGERLESSHYLVSSNSVQVQQGDTQRTIPISALNVDATVAANRARGIDLRIPSKGQIMLGF
jgi:hypothetical protein